MSILFGLDFFSKIISIFTHQSEINNILEEISIQSDYIWIIKNQCSVCDNQINLDSYDYIYCCDNLYCFRCIFRYDEEGFIQIECNVCHLILG